MFIFHMKMTKKGWRILMISQYIIWPRITLTHTLTLFSHKLSHSHKHIEENMCFQKSFHSLIFIHKFHSYKVKVVTHYQKIGLLQFIFQSLFTENRLLKTFATELVYCIFAKKIVTKKKLATNFQPLMKPKSWSHGWLSVTDLETILWPILQLIFSLW